jgi:O-antigen/teichoic acid export membrane protein
VFSTGAAVQLALCVVAVVVCWIVTRALLNALNIPRGLDTELRLAVASAPGAVLSQYAQNWFKWTRARMRFVSFVCLQSGLYVGAVFYALEVREAGLLGVMTATVAAQWGTALVGLWWCRGFMTPRVSSQLLPGLLQFGFPMMLVALAAALVVGLDRLVLTQYVSGTDLGLYAFGQRLSMIMVVVVTAFQTAFGPYAFSVWTKQRAPELFARFQTYYLVAAGIIALIIASSGRVLVRVLGSDAYSGAESVLPLLVLGSMVYGLYSFASLGVFYGKATWRNLLALSAGVATTVIADAALAPRFGGTGVALGFVLGNLALVLVGYALSFRYLRVDFRSSADAVLLGGAALLLFASPWAVAENPWWDGLAKAGLGCGIYGLLALACLHRADRAHLLARLREVVVASR